MLTSVPAVLTTATVHVLRVQTLQDPSVVHVTFPSSEMAKLAAKLHPVINNEILGKCPFTRPLFTLEAHYSNLDCLKRGFSLILILPRSLVVEAESKIWSIVKSNSIIFVISARSGVCNSYFTKSFSGRFPFCLPHPDERMRVSIMTGLTQAKAH